VTALRREPAEKYSPAGKSSGRGRYAAPDKARERRTDDLSGDSAGKEKPMRRHRCFDPPPVTTSRRTLYSQGAPYSRAELLMGDAKRKACMRISRVLNPPGLRLPGSPKLPGDPYSRAELA
jgi:hypothetical protein